MPILYMRCSRFSKRYLNTYLNTLHTLKQSYLCVCVCTPLYAHMFLLVDSPKSSVLIYIRYYCTRPIGHLYCPFVVLLHPVIFSHEKSSVFLLLFELLCILSRYSSKKYIDSSCLCHQNLYIQWSVSLKDNKMENTMYKIATSYILIATSQ